MADSFPLSSLSAQISPSGISAPAFPDIIASLIASYQAIFGSDVYLGPDSQDYEFLAIFSAAINDANNMAIAVYNAFSPAFAQGAGLSNVVKINGLKREIGSNSTADLTVVGVAGTTLAGAIVSDTFGNQWNVPSVTIPGGGSVVVTATAAQAGAINAAPGSITVISTPILGWQSVTNIAAATPGAAVETDPQLRARQSVSTSLPALSVLEAIVGQVANLPGVEAWAPYENDTGTPDGNGIPGHSISLVVEGGDSVQIAQTVALKKTPGTGTYGTTTELVIDQEGMPITINFYRPTVERIVVSVALTAKTGYASTTGDAIVAALAAYVSGLPIGGDVIWSKLFVPANLVNGPLGATFDITAITVGLFGGSLSAADVVMAFNQAASLAVADVTLTVS